MALFGTFRTFIEVEDYENTISEERTYPEDLLPDDPDYDKRGTTEIVEVPTIVKEVKETYENVYALIRIIAIHTTDCDYIDDINSLPENDEDRQSKGYYCFVRFNLYESEEARKQSFTQTILEHDFEELLYIQDINDEFVNANGLFAWAYEQLVTLPQCELMENV